MTLTSFQPWDVFKTVSRKSETIYEATTNWFEVAAKTLKLFFFLLLFLLVLVSAVVSKASLLLMTNAIGNADLVRVLSTLSREARPVLCPRQRDHVIM